MNSMKVQCKLNTLLMNSKYDKTSYPYRLLLNLTDKINLKRSDKYLTLSNLGIYYTQKQSPGGILKKCVLRNFAKFTGKHLCQSLFLNKFAGLRLQLGNLWRICL